jgi:hypothetical protein
LVEHTNNISFLFQFRQNKTLAVIAMAPQVETLSTTLREKDFTGTKPQASMKQHEAIAEYRKQHRWQTITIDAEVLINSLPQKRC